MAKLNLKKIDPKKIIISFLLVIALVVQFSFLSYLFRAIMPQSDENEDNVIMSYTQSGNLDYKVYLKQNEFIDDEYLGENEAYILDLIDHVSVTSLYNFKSTTKTNVAGTNKLVATLKVYYKESNDRNENPEVMTREQIIDEKVINFNDDTYSTIGSYDIYLNDYLNMVKEFQSEVKISLDAYLEISMQSEFQGSVGGASYNDDYDTLISIPLSESVVQIEKQNIDEKTEKIYESDLVKTNQTVMSYIVIANIVTFIIICLLLRKLFVFTNKTSYERTLNKILKNYDDIIVNTSTILEVNKYKLIEIEEFKEILNLSRELLLPIMNYEVIKGKETWFYVIKDDILYRYVVSLDKMEKKKMKNKEVKRKIKKKKNIKQIITNIVLASFVIPLGFIIYRIITAPVSNDLHVANIKVKSDYVLMFIQCILGIVALFIPNIISKKKKITIPNAIYIVYVIFLYAAIFLGEVRDFYYRVPHWDSILHTFSGGAIASLGFSVVSLLNNQDKVSINLSPFFVALFSFCFAVTLGAFWEIYEFTFDGLLGLNMQKFALENGTNLVGRMALMDTMKDLIVDSIGALVISIIGYISLKYKKGWFDKLMITKQKDNN